MSEPVVEAVRSEEPSQDRAHHSSRAARVTLFEDRAEVVRRASFRAAKGTRWEAIAGVSLLVDDGTVQARITRGEARVLSARVLRRAHEERALGREEIEALEREVRAARDRVVAADQAVDRLQRALGQHDELATQWVKSASLGPRKASDPGVMGSYREGWRAIDVSAKATLDEMARVRAERAQTEVDRRRAEARLAEGRAETPRYDAVIELEIEAHEEGDVEVELTYRLPCALWRPEHLARLTSDGPDATAGSVEIVTYAAAWQRTGEAWDDVELRFSTARPTRAASPPLLSDDVLSTRRKTEEERRNIVVAAREQSIELAGLDRGDRATAEMPGVDDGGEPVTYTGKERASLPSNGRPCRVEIGRAAVKAELARLVVAVRSPAAHLRATATLEGAGPLLAGPVRLARGASLVGRARLDFVGKGEPFELGFGPDDAIRVRRSEDEKRDTQAITGAQRLERKVTLYLSNLSSRARKVLVTERIPVSEIEDVEIHLAEAGGISLDKDGFLRATVDVGAHATRTLSYTFEVRAGARVTLPAF
ncbi:mucoidy inhibitor MuiA family protein [Polyangium spumosum]|uniref:mucoidy inhibitor MuiA family protein n=1 Tax=Polyangium spumosum TaxID=889282 RepID=UPI001478591F